MRKLATAVVAALCLCGLGACAKQAVITKPMYVAAANDTCGAAAQQEAQLVVTWVQDNPDDTGPDATERFVRFTLIKHLRNTMNALRSIPAPPGDATYLGSMFQDYDHALDIFYLDTLGHDSDSAQQSAEGRFKVYGLSKCASLAADANKDIDKKLNKARADEAKAKDKAGATTTTVATA